MLIILVGNVLFRQIRDLVPILPKCQVGLTELFHFTENQS